ncbi:MAG TPA: peptidoglycan-binding protein, partial [Devosia sp.]|nr:peptidoglycan-binding protein [Devosia sp.]
SPSDSAAPAVATDTPGAVEKAAANAAGTTQGTDTVSAPAESPKDGPDANTAADQQVGVINPTSHNVRMIAPPTADVTPPAEVSLASLSAPDAAETPSGVAMPPAAVGPIELRRMAAQGDPRVQFEVAAILAEGRVLPQDLAGAAVWYERAAAQGFAPASYRLANMLENGVGVEKDLSRARLWYQLAADAGNRMSMHNLASLLAGGKLGEQDFERAAYWFGKAAALGLKDSQFNLAMLYARGLGVPQNLEESFKWFSIAASLGDQDAAKARDDIARSLDAQVATRISDETKGWQPDPLNIPANFAPIGTWSPDFDPGPAITDKNVIRQVQAALNRIGYDTGTPDGLMGPKTEEAIRAFETQTGMSQSGRINPRLLAVLGSQPV